MPISLKDLQNQGATIEIDYFGMTSEVQYDPTRFTPAFRTEYAAKEREEAAERSALINGAVQSAKDGEEPVAATPSDMARGNARLLCMLVKGWDIIDIKGKPLPVKEDAILEALPEALVNHIISEIWKDVRFLGKREPTASDS